ncbi:MAG: PfkB family carbohydrate kinase [Dehalococcoidia bacterium]|nr:PfkB family carbohydrate kinase [Dehalococcoidia bacterium]
MSLLVVGSVALDTVETPFGQVSEALGGSATYFSTAASFFTPVRLVAVVGEDFPSRHLDFLRERKVDLKGLQVDPGRTFRWSGFYEYDLNTAHTRDTQLNVFASFHPQLPETYRDSPFVFLANIDPDLQIEVLQQVGKPRLAALDTMNYWIETKRESLTKAVSMVDLVVMNEAEVREFGGSPSLIKAARRILDLGPQYLVIKKGEDGAVMVTSSGFSVAPAYPLEEVRDPTGAGDTFAGGMMGYLAQCGEPSLANLRMGMIHGSVLASFTVEDFSLERLRILKHEEIRDRVQEFKSFSCFVED